MTRCGPQGNSLAAPQLFSTWRTDVDKVNLDELLNYKEEYSKFVQKPEYKKERMTSLCPFHDDRKPSFSVDLKTGKFVCFACGKAGNYVSFRAELDGCSNADAYKRILREHGVDEAKKEPTRQNYTVDDYAKEKNLPADWLRMVCSLEDGKEKDGTPYVKIPYFGEDGKPKVTRKRMGPHKFKWGFGSAGKHLHPTQDQQGNKGHYWHRRPAAQDDRQSRRRS